MAKRLSRRKTMKRKNILKRKSLKRNSLRRKNLRRKSIKKRGGVSGMDDSLTRTKEFLTRNANKLVGPLKNCSNVFLANRGNYPHIVDVSFDEENHRLRYDLQINLQWLEPVPEPVPEPAENIVGYNQSWMNDDYWRSSRMRTKVYRATKSYSELYSDCDMEGIDFFTESRVEKMKAFLENSFDFKAFLENSFDFKKNKDEECKKRFKAIENVVEFYEKEMNDLLKDVRNLPQIEEYLSSLAWISEEERAREREQESEQERARKR